MRLWKNTKFSLALPLLAFFAFALGVSDGFAREELPLLVKEEELLKTPRPLYAPDEIIVRFKIGVREERARDFNRQQETVEVYESPYARFKVLKIPPTKTVEEMVGIYKKNPQVEYAEPNFIYCASWYPNDPYYPYQWHFDNPAYGGIQMEQAWDISTGASSVIVAVVDTGVAYEDYPVPAYELGTIESGVTTYMQAPDFAGTNFVSGYDYVHNDAHPNDNNSHGTHVAGTIAQATNNAVGVAGIAPNTSLMPVKVLDQAGCGYSSDIADGINFATASGAKVINLSLGGSSPATVLENAVANAYNSGVTVVAASGNDGSSQIIYPAAYDAYVIAVGATRYDETRAYYSNYGASLDLVAPGGDVSVDQNDDGYADGVLQNTFAAYKDKRPWCVSNSDTKADPTDFSYWFFNGTSMSTPHVSGVAALLLAQDSNRTPDEIRNILQSTAEDKGVSGWDQYYGWGIVDAYAALSSLVPAVSISLTTDGTVDFGILALGEAATSLEDAQTVRVETGPADLNVKSTVFADNGNAWILGAATGPNQVIWEYSPNASDWTVFAAADVTYPLASGVIQEDAQDIYFRLTMPTETDSNNQYSTAVTIVATAP